MANEYEEIDVATDPVEDPGYVDEEIDTLPKEDEDPEEKPFAFSEDESNLVPIFQEHPIGEKALKDLVQQCHDEFKTS